MLEVLRPYFSAERKQFLPNSLLPYSRRHVLGVFIVRDWRMPAVARVS
jgi:hypothetical protein